MVRRTPCRDCGQRIMLVRTPPSEKRPKGGWMPLDPEPNPAGNVAIDGTMRAVVVGVGHPLHRGELYMPHFATCPARARRPPERADVDG